MSNTAIILPRSVTFATFATKKQKHSFKSTKNEMKCNASDPVPVQKRFRRTGIELTNKATFSPLNSQINKNYCQSSLFVR
jgi:hypothetical protein